MSQPHATGDSGFFMLPKASPETQGLLQMYY